MAQSGLTARQMEVARLAAARLSDQEIADRLRISLSTVDSHMRDVRKALGISSRRQIAARLGINSLESEIGIPDPITVGPSGHASATNPSASGGDERTLPRSRIARWVLSRPLRIAGSRLPVILGWFFAGLVFLACVVGLANAVFMSGDPLGRRAYANADKGSAHERAIETTPDAGRAR